MTRDEAIEILSRPRSMKNVPDDIVEAHEMAIEALEQIEKIESIINGPVCMQGYVPKYMDICEVLKEAEHDQRRRDDK